MENHAVRRLHLLTPLRYALASPPEDGLFPLKGAEPPPRGGEEVLCFGINPAEAHSGEPAKENYLGPLLFRGKLRPPPPGMDKVGAGEEQEGPDEEIPRGSYLFVQERIFLSREKTLELAVELQKEGLWEGLTLGDRLYIRRFFEEGIPVTQVWRPLRL
jgi:hypothetical protein